jgi:putative SOS response-associated peptidase YedK
VRQVHVNVFLGRGRRILDAPGVRRWRRGEAGGNDEIVTHRVNGLLPVIVWDAEEQKRRVVPMRWGFPHPKDWRRPQPIHARAETVDVREPFRVPFHAGQRGIVVFRTFNEGEAVTKPSGKTETRQWTIDPQDGRPRGFAFIWRRFEIPDLPAPMVACVMVTVPANELIRRTIKSREEAPACLPSSRTTPWRPGWARMVRRLRLPKQS